MTEKSDILARPPPIVDVLQERERQDAKWGVQNHPSFSSAVAGWPVMNRARYYGIDTDDELRGACEGAFKLGKGSYAHIFLEEAAEAICAPDEQSLRAELVQVAAVAIAWIESIDRRAALDELTRQGQEAGDYDNSMEHAP